MGDVTDAEDMLITPLPPVSSLPVFDSPPCPSPPLSFMCR
jgi:hypothetical protein